MYGQRDSIHSSIEQRLEWERLDDKRASRIALYRNGSIESNEEELIEIKAWHIESLLLLKKHLAPFVKKGVKSI